MTARRVRRAPEEAQSLILDAAASLLAEGGVAAVQMRAVAARVGMTDAGVAHHFGNREALLRGLLRHGGRQLRAAVDHVLEAWLAEEPDLLQLVQSLAEVYEQGYGELAAALHAAGWRDRGTGMLEPLVEALHKLRRDGDDTSIDDTRLAVAALHQAIALEPLYGSAFRRSAGFPPGQAAEANAQLRWWTGQLAGALGLDERVDRGDTRRRVHQRPTGQPARERIQPR